MTDAAFACRMCGHCCEGVGGIVLTEKDQRRLPAHLSLSVAELLERHAELRGGKYQLLCGEDGYCVFYKQDCGCGIHPARPDVCRAWPFFRGNLVDESSWEMIQEYCPGVNPHVAHAEFVRQGSDYLTGEGLRCKCSGEAPNALTPEDRTGGEGGNGNS